MTSYVGRFAPSPTGLLHLGNMRTALFAWQHARSQRGTFLLRIEDLDVDRCRPEFIDGIYRDLEFLGLDFDGPVWRQSERASIYDEALTKLLNLGRIYPCTCTRSEIARAASAPHEGEEGPIYPRTCRSRSDVTTRHHSPKSDNQNSSIRFIVTSGVTEFTDAIFGSCSQDVERVVGDFAVRRFDGVASYQLAVVLDDALSGVTHVVRGSDLLSSTARQIQLMVTLGLAIPHYVHVPLIMQPDGKRLAKRTPSTTIAGLRASGVRAESIVGFLAQLSGLHDGTDISAHELAAGFNIANVSRAPSIVTDEMLSMLQRRSR